MIVTLTKKRQRCFNLETFVDIQDGLTLYYFYHVDVEMIMVLMHTTILHNIAQQFKDPVLFFFTGYNMCKNAKLHNIFFHRYTMNRLMNTLQFKTACLTLVFLSCIFSQTLYESDYQQYTILNRESKDVSLQYLLDETESLLKTKTFNLQNCIEMKDAYNDSLILNNQEQTPSCGNILFFEYCIFFFFMMAGGRVKYLILSRLFVCNELYCEKTF